MRFTVIRAPSPYNVILGRSVLKALRAIPSTNHSMMKFPTPRGIATLATRSSAVSECRKIEESQVGDEEEVEVAEHRLQINESQEIMVNPAYPDQLVTVGSSLTKGCKAKLKALLIRNICLGTVRHDGGAQTDNGTPLEY